MASTEILKNLIKINGSTSSPKRIDKKETGSSNKTEIKTVKVVTAGSTIVVYDIFKEYGYTGISYTATSANPVAASGGSIVPYVSANKIGNSGATYGSLTLTSTTGVSGAKLSYSLSLASGVTGVSVNSKSGIVTVDNRGTTEDSNFDPVKVGSVKLSITGISTPLASNDIYREANTATVTYGVPTGTITWNSGTWNGKTYYAPDLSSVSVNNNYKYTSGATKTVSGNYGVNINADSVGDYDSVRSQVISLIDTTNENGYAYGMGEYTLQGSTFNDVGLDFSSFRSSMNTMYGYNIPASVSGIQDSSNIYSALTTLAANGYIPPVEAIWPVGLTSEQDWVIKISVFNEDDVMVGELTSEFAIPNSKRVVSSVISRYEPYITLENEGININTTSGYTSNVYSLGGRTIFNNTVKYASGYETNETVTTIVDPELSITDKTLDISAICGNSDFTVSITGVNGSVTPFNTAYLKAVSLTPRLDGYRNLRMQFYMNGSTLEHLIDNPKKATITLTYHGVSVTKNLVVSNKLTNITINSLYVSGTPFAATAGKYNVSSNVTLTYRGGTTKTMTLSNGVWSNKPEGITVTGTASLLPVNNTGALISGVGANCVSVSIAQNYVTSIRTQGLKMTVTAADYLGGLSADKSVTLTQKAAEHETIDYTVSNKSTYGFRERNDGTPFHGSKRYYESNNYAVNNSAASAVVKVTLYGSQTGFKVYFISSGEVPDSGEIDTGDYGMVSPLSNTNEFTLGDPNEYGGGSRVRFNASDIPLSSYVDGMLENNRLHCAEYSGLSAGTYYVSVKYIKDSSVHVPNDSMRFIVLPIGDTYTGKIGDGKYHGPAIGSSSGSTGGTTPTPPPTTEYTIEPNKWPKFTYVDKNTGAAISELTPGSSGYPGYLSDNVYFYLGELRKNGSYISDFGYTSSDAGAFMSTALYNSPNNTHVNGDYFTINVESADRVINADLGDDVATHEPIKFTDAKRIGNRSTFEKDGSKVKVSSGSADRIIGNNGMTNISCNSTNVTFIPTNGECPEIIMIADN